jgi:hypothetical protein
MDALPLLQDNWRVIFAFVLGDEPVYGVAQIMALRLVARGATVLLPPETLAMPARPHPSGEWPYAYVSVAYVPWYFLPCCLEEAVAVHVRRRQVGECRVLGAKQTLFYASRRPLFPRP